MKSISVVTRIALAAVLISAMAGYRLGAGRWPFTRVTEASMPMVAAKAITPAERKVLYWKDPDGKSDFSPMAIKTSDGRDYVPVYEDDEPGFKGTRAVIRAVTAGGARKIVYYRNPMGLPDTSPVPKKDSMGMDYIAVYDGDDEGGSTVKVSLDKIQRSGVRTQPAQMLVMSRPIHAPAVAKPDERTLRTVTLRADGFIEKLYVNETGAHVTAGEPLFRVYSPAMVSAQVDYRAGNPPQSRELRSEQGARQRLKNLDIPDSVFEALRASGNPAMSIEWPSPVSGVVMQKKIIEGQMVKAGEELYRLADLSSIWVIADVSEQDIASIKVGAPAKIMFRAYPDKPFVGRVTFILHELDTATRTAKIRIEVKNPDHLIKHEMYADVDIDSGDGDVPRLVVPSSAVIDSGSRQVVIVDRGQGRFEPRPVKIGLRGAGTTEILEGLKEGEPVVVSANFLIDAESNLKAALQGFTAEPVSSTDMKMEVKP